MISPALGRRLVRHNTGAGPHGLNRIRTGHQLHLQELRRDNRGGATGDQHPLHVLCGVVFCDYGALVTGGNLGPDKARMDFESEDLSPERLAAIERRAYKENANGREVRVLILPCDQAFQRTHTAGAPPAQRLSKRPWPRITPQHTSRCPLTCHTAIVRISQPMLLRDPQHARAVTPALRVYVTPG